MKSWATHALAVPGRRQHLLRIALAVVVLGALLWALPVRRPGEEGEA